MGWLLGARSLEGQVAIAQVQVALLTSRLSRFSDQSILSLASSGSILSIASAGSILSVGSVGSVLSIGSVGSFLSLFSVGSLLSCLCVGSSLSILRHGAISNRRRGALAGEPIGESLEVAAEMGRIEGQAEPARLKAWDDRDPG
jgi:hypothetical protein